MHSIKSPGQDMEEDKHHKQQPGARMLVFVDVYSCFHNYRMHHMQPVYREIKDDVMLLNSKASTMLDRVKYVKHRTNWGRPDTIHPNTTMKHCQEETKYSSTESQWISIFFSQARRILKNRLLGEAW